MRLTLTAIALLGSLLPAFAGLHLLHVSPAHRYFTNTLGQAVYLTGKHAWPTLVNNCYYGTNDLSNGSAYDAYNLYLDQIAANSQNLIKLWPSDSLTDTGSSPYQTPMAYGRSGTPGAPDGGNKFDLATFNTAYFQRLSNIVAYANTKNVYVAIMFFDGYRSISPDFGDPDYWSKSVYNSANNVNGVLAGMSDMWRLNANGSAITNVMAEYVKHTIDSVGMFSNVLWEVMIEAPVYSTNFQHLIVQVVKSYEATGGRLVHPIGMSACYYTSGGSGNLINAAVTNTTHWSGTQLPDYFMPGAKDPNDSGSDVYTNSPPALGAGPAAPSIPVVILDTDHIWWNGYGGNNQGTVTTGSKFAWWAFTRGYSTLYMDGHANPGPYLSVLNTNMMLCMKDTMAIAARMDLLTSGASDSISSTGWCLTNATDAVIYQPAAADFTATLAPGVYSAEWFDPIAHAGVITNLIRGNGASRSFARPTALAESVVYVQSLPARTATTTTLTAATVTR